MGSSANRIDGPHHERASERDSLLLAAGELGRIVRAAIMKADALQKVLGARRARRHARRPAFPSAA